ncbi:arylsulfatase A-like enzyme [Algoriphagus boseongensis]|uniref:Arylsulfatase A-like enzyme n=1 Tax=Algoriphagus boseongensis TaxID=1442587 RepID=A0A4R6T434_9BACT|nr:sulfatase [Algoriphagus boseongensis]TDQ15085.1 arylsulfatase A-like enzyme [Algoriphagus boseongensis]
MKKSIFFSSFLVLLFSLVLQANGQEKKPNILFILVDDLGYHDLGITGSKFYLTPNIDRLGNASYRFTQGYTNSPVCSPARASLMTGVTPAIHHITDWIGAAEGEEWRKAGRFTKLLPPSYEHHLDHAALTLPEALKAAGYETFFAGKWHLGSEGSYPEDHGFDTNIGGYESGSPMGGYFAPYQNPKLVQGPDGENLSMRLGNETARFIEGKHDKPFFAMLSFYAVHSPIQTTEEKWKKYRDRAEAAGLTDQGYEMERRLPIRVVQDNPVYAGLVEVMDEAVGRVLEALEKSGELENTLIVFTSDHGGVASGDNYSTSNLPLRGGKGYQWEGGLRVPFFIKMPGQTSGKEMATLAQGMDLYPTLLDAVGVKIPEGLEGISMIPAINQKQVISRNLYWHYPHYGNQGGDPSSIIRQGDWKLIYYWEDGHQELYNLKSDPQEQVDLASKEPAVVQKLSGELMTYLEKTNANKPQVDPEYDPVKEKAYLEKVKNERWPELEKARKEILQPGWQPDPTWWGSKVTKD